MFFWPRVTPVYKHDEDGLDLVRQVAGYVASEVGVVASDQADHFLSVIIFTVWRTI